MEMLKYIIPGLIAFCGLWLTNRKERRQWMAQQEDAQSRLLVSQSDRLAAGWAEMTTQARELIGRLQIETIEAKTRAALAEERAAELNRELETIKRKYAQALTELEELRKKAPRVGGSKIRPIKEE